jgi:hypothetical protein
MTREFYVLGKVVRVKRYESHRQGESRLQVTIYKYSFRHSASGSTAIAMWFSKKDIV